MVIICNNNVAQINTVYTFGVIGSELKIATNSSPLSVNMNKCLKISNGISKFTSTNVGDFESLCAVDLIYTKVNIQVMPNPFTDAIFIKFISKIGNDNHFQISVFNNFGHLQKMENVNQDLLYNGYKMQLSTLPTGIYFLHISTKNISEIFKIVKND